MIKHTCYLFNDPQVIFDLTDTNSLCTYPFPQKTLVVKGFIVEATNLKGRFGLRNGKGLLSVLKRKNTSISAYNEAVNGITSGFTLYNEETGVETDFYFDKYEKLDIKNIGFRSPVDKYQVSFPVDNVFRDRFIFQAKAINDVKTFCIENKKDNCTFCFGLLGSMKGNIVVKNLDKNVELNRDWHFPVKIVSKVLKMTGRLVMKISDQGFIIVECFTDYAKYSYVIFASFD